MSFFFNVNMQFTGHWPEGKGSVFVCQRMDLIGQLLALNLDNFSQINTLRQRVSVYNKYPLFCSQLYHYSHSKSR